MFKSRWILHEFFIFEDCIHSKDSLFCLQLVQCLPPHLRTKNTGSFLFLSLYVKLANYKTTISQLQGITQPQKTDVDTYISQLGLSDSSWFNTDHCCRG